MTQIFNRGGNAVALAHRQLNCKELPKESLYPLRLFIVGKYRGNRHELNHGAFYNRNDGACVVGSMSNMLFNGDPEDTTF